jgi:hypothetical protein
MLQVNKRMCLFHLCKDYATFTVAYQTPRQHSEIHGFYNVIAIQ